MKKVETDIREREGGKWALSSASISICLYLCLSLAISSRPAQADSPTDTTRRLIESMRAYQAENTSSQNHRHALQQKIEENLAIAQLAEWFLGPYWQKVGAQEQKNFTALLTRFIRETAYPRAAEFLVKMRIEYGSEQVTGSEALVETTAAQPEEGEIRIDYRLRQIQGKWMVWDVLLDRVSMATNLRSQIQSVIRKKSYQELIKRMEKKLEQEDKRG